MAGALVFGAGMGHAAPVYIGLQIAGYLGGAITTEATGSGTASINNKVYGTTGTPIFQTSVSVQRNSAESGA